MKIKFLLLLSIFATSVFTACIKLNGSSLSYNNNSYPFHIKTGDDDDQPTYVEVTRKRNGQTIQGATVMLINGMDTLSGITNDSGFVSLSPVVIGNNYGLLIEHALYQPVSENIVIVSQQTNRTDTLDVQ